MAFNPIQIVINAKDNASAVFSSLQAKVTAVAAAIASYFGFQAFVGVVNGAKDLEAAMSRVQAATGATGAEMKDLRAMVQDVGANTKFSAVEAAGALEELGKAGVTAADAVKVLPPVIRLAEAAGVDLGRATEVTTSIIMGLGLQFTDAARVADVLAMGANATKTSVEGLGQALSYAAPVARGLGLSLEATTAIIGQFAQSGIDASRAGTALNSILSQFTDPASKFREQLLLIGISTNDFEKALHQLAAAGPAGAAAIQSVGLEAGPALRALINQGMGALDGLKGKLLESAGSAEATAKIMRDNLNGSLKQLSGTWETVKNVLGTPVLPVLKDGVEQLTAALRRAVGDGTVAKFGESLATAFKNGIQWMRDFVGAMDFDTIAAKMQAFADGFNDKLTSISSTAATTGNAIKTFYGVMAGGANGVMTAVYGIGASYTEAAIRIVDFAAKASDALSKISIGQARADLIQQANEMRATLGGLMAVRDAYLERMHQSLADTATAAQIARDGFQGVADGVNKTAAASAAASPAIDSVVQGLIDSAEATAKLTAEQEKKAQADAKAKEELESVTKALQEQKAQVEALWAEYAKHQDAGNLQGMIDVQTEIDKLQKAIAISAQDMAAKQIKGNTDAAAAAEQNRAKVAELKAEYDRQISLGDFEKAVEIMAQLDEAQRAVGKSAEQTSAQIEAASKTLETRNRIIEAGLNLELAQSRAAEANWRAQGNLLAATHEQIKQKEIEIKIIEAKVKAMNDEADSTVRVAEAKLREMAATKEVNPIKEADLKNTIEMAKVKKLEAEALETTTGKLRAEIDAIWRGTDARGKEANSIRGVAAARDAATAALERENAERERAIAAQEKANQLMEREAELQRKKWNIDKEGFSLDANGQRVGGVTPTANYVLNAAKNAGLDEKTAVELLNQFDPTGRKLGGGAGVQWFDELNKAIADLVVQETRKRAQQQGQGGTTPAPAASAPAPAPTPAPAPSGRGISAPVQPVTVHINLGGAIDLGTQTGLENLARKLTPAFNNLARRGATPLRTQ